MGVLVRINWEIKISMRIASACSSPFLTLFSFSFPYDQKSYTLLARLFMLVLCGVVEWNSKKNISFTHLTAAADANFNLFFVYSNKLAFHIAVSSSTYCVECVSVCACVLYVCVGAGVRENNLSRPVYVTFFFCSSYSFFFLLQIVNTLFSCVCT